MPLISISISVIKYVKVTLCLDDFEQPNNTAMLVPNTNTREQQGNTHTHESRVISAQAEHATAYA